MRQGCEFLPHMCFYETKEPKFTVLGVDSVERDALETLGDRYSTLYQYSPGTKGHGSLKVRADVAGKRQMFYAMKNILQIPSTPKETP